MTHVSNWVPIQRRPLTEAEKKWVNDILSANREWADVSVGDLFATAKCPCGLCKTVLLELPAHPHNPNSELGWLGEIDIQTSAGDFITVMLHARAGSLTELEVINEHSFKEVPESWTEVARWVNVP